MTSKDVDTMLVHRRDAKPTLIQYWVNISRVSMIYELLRPPLHTPCIYSTLIVTVIPQARFLHMYDLMTRLGIERWYLPLHEVANTTYLIPRYLVRTVMSYIIFALYKKYLLVIYTV